MGSGNVPVVEMCDNHCKIGYSDYMAIKIGADTLFRFEMKRQWSISVEKDWTVTITSKKEKNGFTLSKSKTKTWIFRFDETKSKFVLTETHVTHLKTFGNGVMLCVVILMGFTLVTSYHATSN